MSIVIQCETIICGEKKVIRFPNARSTGEAINAFEQWIKMNCGIEFLAGRYPFAVKLVNGVND